ncbi:hypothetical protein RhiLY_05369 [Ceratobasidium sp. AG-Ba]|nr:hypothetical protein RhiLY_05369 [Ceratobasidium sp. AG-Ba]
MSAGLYLRTLFAHSNRLYYRPIVARTRLFQSFPPRFQQTPSPQSAASQENLYGGHSRFIAEAKRSESWSDGVDNSKKGGEEGTGKSRGSARGDALYRSPVPNLVASLQAYSPDPDASSIETTTHCLSSASISAALTRLSPYPSITPLETSTSTSIAFRSIPHKSSSKESYGPTRPISDFVKEAAQDREFAITMSKPAPKSDSSSSSKPDETQIRILVPSFRTRTRFLRHRLKNVSNELERLEKIKRECDHIAHRSARRLALGGFAMLLVYFGVVARLTFWDLGWYGTCDVPVWPYGLLPGICGFCIRAVKYRTRCRSMGRPCVRGETAPSGNIKIADDYNIKWDGSPDGKFTVLNAIDAAASKPKSTEKEDEAVTPCGTTGKAEEAR